MSLSVLVGVMAALPAKALLLAINITQAYIHPEPLAQLVKSQGIEHATLSLWSVGTLVVFGLIVGLLTHYLMPIRMNRGLSHVIEDVHFNHGHTGVREGAAAGLISAVSIGAGASVGRYGPAVHLGAAAASGVGTFFKLEDQEKLTLSCAGIAAAISASFLAPLAAVIFVQEVVLRQWRIYQFIPVAAAAVGGLILGIIGFAYPPVLGFGSYETELAVAGEIALKFCLILLVLKFIATIVSLAFDFNGGVFGPSLFMGAMIGASVGIIVEGAGITISGISLYAIAGMGATVATVIGAVFTAIIAMIEMTGKLSPSLPLLFSVSSAYVLVYLFSQSSLLVNQLNGRGKNPFREIQAKDKKYDGYSSRMEK